MILTKEVEVKICGINTKHYEGLGYKVKRWEIIIVPIEHLSRGSMIKIKVKCDICGKERELSYKSYLKNIKKYRFYSCLKCKEIKRKLTNKELYGDENYVNVEKNKQTKLECYGDENYRNSKKIKETCLELYGVEFPLCSKEIREKCLQTKFDIYGDRNYNNTEQFKKTMIGRWGSIREKGKQTCIEKYGVEYPIQNIEIFEKIFENSFKKKNYKLPSDKIVKIQGYENLALDLLLKKYEENDLLIENKDIENKIGKIFYIDKQGKKRKYYPDIYILSENKIIEVKSDWTFKSKKEINLLKEQSCLDIGIKFEFMVFNSKKQLLTKNEVKKLF